MSRPMNRRAFTLAELLVALALMALVIAASGAGIFSAEVSHRYSRAKVDLVNRMRGTLERMASDVYRAEGTLVSEDMTAMNVLVERQGGGQKVWRQYRYSATSETSGCILMYESTSPIPFPPNVPDESVPCAVLTEDVKTFQVYSLVTSTRNISETLSCRITATCGPNAGNTFTVPMTPGPYVLKLSQTQVDYLHSIGQLEECVDVDPKPEYVPDDNPNVYWLCLEDAQAPPVALPNADWDHNDFMLKVTEGPTSVQMEVHWGTAAYDRDVMGPDGELLYGDIGGSHTYTYVPYCTDTDTVKIGLELENDTVTAGATISATQRKAYF